MEVLGALYLKIWRVKFGLGGYPPMCTFLARKEKKTEKIAHVE
ncbi:hypothetical protein QG37_05136 [Candidozyma auris]|uniref:Uncharacterized protein n=1 Tax=Candidozyma auris TaxID=498019 RepID=A0A0L0NVG3_CANAR|nr:hypothetical protein QG37_05136 [[Candida] auris]